MTLTIAKEIAKAMVDEKDELVSFWWFVIKLVRSSEYRLKAAR